MVGTSGPGTGYRGHQGDLAKYGESGRDGRRTDLWRHSIDSDPKQFIRLRPRGRSRRRQRCADADSNADTNGNSDRYSDGNANGYTDSDSDSNADTDCDADCDANADTDSYTDGYSDGYSDRNTNGNADGYSDGYADSYSNGNADSDAWWQCLYTDDYCYRRRLVPGRHCIVWRDERTWFGNGRSRQRGNGLAITDSGWRAGQCDSHHSAVYSGDDGSGCCHVYYS